jgi:hypothetical protein
MFRFRHDSDKRDYQFIKKYTDTSINMVLKIH